MNKIVFLIDSFQTGGAEKSILEIASRMKSFEVAVVVLFADKDDLRQAYIKAGITTFDLALNRSSLLWYIEGKRKFQKLCAQINPAVVHAHLFKSELIARISSLPRSTILIGALVNDSYSPMRYAEQSALRNLKLNVVKWIDRLTVQRNFRLTSISRAIAISNGKALHYPLEKIRLIYRGREVGEGLTGDREVSSPGSPFIFLVVSRLLIRKGYKELIDAVAKMKAQTPDFKVLAAGDGVDKSAIIDYAKERETTDIIEFLGYRNDIPLLLRQADCFLFPSHYEGQGGSLVEAMLAQKPVIVSDIEVFREQIDDGRSGLFFKVGDASDLANKMMWIMKNYNAALQLASNAREEAKRRFNIVRTVEEYENFYREVIGEYSRSREI